MPKIRKETERTTVWQNACLAERRMIIRRSELSDF